MNTRPRPPASPLIACGLAGAAMESMVAFAAVLTHSAPSPVTYAAAVWNAGLWLAFGTTLGITAAARGAQLVIEAAVFGALFTPRIRGLPTVEAQDLRAEPVAGLIRVIGL